jgi:2-polyprenyl-3-methyl-5-hydroxy-6-metoxy-1,4-benzoquinol methylase
MNQSQLSAEIIRSWEENSHAWTATVRENLIESRILATNAAILDAIGQLQPRRILDVGCGEGWLAHALDQNGFDVVGFDGCADLIRRCQEKPGNASFLQLCYEELVRNPLVIHGLFDCVACNYSLFDENIRPLLSTLRTKLADQGTLVIQTLNPHLGDESAQSSHSGWRIEDFRSMSVPFPSKMPYYFRSLESWLNEFDCAGLELFQVREPLHPRLGTPLSLILSATAR